MREADLQVYKERLQLLGARLRRDMSSMADAALSKTRSEACGDLSSMPIHMADIGSENFEQEFTLGLIAAEEHTLEMVDNALQRIEEGEYGVCLACQGRIPKTRLNVIPYALHCVKCASELENSHESL